MLSTLLSIVSAHFSSPRTLRNLVLRPLLRVEKAICHARHLHHLRDIVDADDMRPVQNARGNRCGRAPDALFRWGRFSVPRQRCAEESLARSTHQKWVAELCQLGKFL